MEVQDLNQLADMEISEFLVIAEESNLSELQRYKNSLRLIELDLSSTYKQIMQYLLNNKKELKKEENISEYLHRICSIGNFIGKIRAKIEISEHIYNQKVQKSCKEPKVDTLN